MVHYTNVTLAVFLPVSGFSVVFHSVFEILIEPARLKVKGRTDEEVNVNIPIKFELKGESCDAYISDFVRVPFEKLSQLFKIRCIFPSAIDDVCTHI